MALDTNNFKEVGGPGNSQDGGQVYSIFSTTDSIEDMRTSAYLDALVNSLNVRDIIHLTGVDGALTVQVHTNTGTSISTRPADSIRANEDDATSGAISLNTEVTVLTDGSAQTGLTLANGYQGQVKTVITNTAQAHVLTPDFRIGGYATLTYSAIGDSVTLMFDDPDPAGTTPIGWRIINLSGVVRG